MRTIDFHLAVEQQFHLYEALSKFKQIFLPIDYSQEGITEWAAGPVSNRNLRHGKRRGKKKILPLA